VADQTQQPAPLAHSSEQPEAPAAYEEIVARLSQVVERLESGGLSLEESIAAFEQGIQLARLGQRKLEQAEKKVELLLENDRVQPFASGEADPARRR
jgi:exodeoxyribonuclease VII small subunit